MYSRCPLAWLFFCLLLSGGNTLAEEPAEKPIEVTVARPVARELTDHADFTGRTEASTRVNLRSRVTGYLVKVNFQDGEEVKQGAVLFEIDPRLYQAQFEQARAQRDLALAQLSVAEKNLVRLRALLERAPGSVSEQELDQARAAVVEAKARLEVHTASLEIRKLELAFTRITAPINGRIGRRLIDAGNLVKADETSLAVLVTADPLHVHFDIDERTLLRVRRLAAQGTGDEKVPITIGLASSDTLPHQGVVNFSAAGLDAQTGTLRMRAVVPNKDGGLLPGLFVRGRLALGQARKALLVPASAVRVEKGETFVLVVNDKNVLEKRPVVLGQQVQGEREVTGELKQEDCVVVQALQGLRPGTLVRPRLAGSEEKPKAGQERGAGPRFSFGALASAGGRGILVETIYPGASAQVVSEAVRAPIEEQIGGLENLRSLRSRCTSDGRYVAHLSFPPGSDLSIRQVLTQNRTALASPTLPDAVRAHGITVRRGSSNVLLFVNLVCPDGRYDRRYLANYAHLQIKDELSRVAGVSGATLLGPVSPGLHLWLDLEKLAARNLTASDVMKRLRQQNIQVAPGPGRSYLLKTAGRLAPDEINDIVLESGGEGPVVRLRDVARIELGAETSGSPATLDGKPVVPLVVAMTGDVSAERVRSALRERLAEISERLPRGLALDLSFDFTANLQSPAAPTAPEYLLLDVDLPAAVSDKLSSRAAELVGQTPGVGHVLALPENPFDLFGSGPCLLVRKSPSSAGKSNRETLIQAMRKRLDEIAQMKVRVRDLSSASGYPIDFALRGPELERLRAWAEKLGERLGRDRKLADVWLDPASTPRPRHLVEVDRQKATSLGVTAQDVLDTLQVMGGAENGGDFTRAGRVWNVEVQAGSSEWLKEYRKLKVRNRQGEMVPLAAFASVRQVAAPLVLDFLDGLPMLEITANRGAGVSVEDARKFCATQAEELRKELGLPAEYRLSWLRDMTAAR